MPELFGGRVECSCKTQFSSSQSITLKQKSLLKAMIVISLHLDRQSPLETCFQRSASWIFFKFQLPEFFKNPQSRIQTPIYRYLHSVFMDWGISHGSHGLSLSYFLLLINQKRKLWCFLGVAWLPFNLYRGRLLKSYKT